MSSRLRTASAKNGCRCSGSSECRSGTTDRCVRNWRDRSRAAWATPTACWSSIPSAFPKSGRESVGVARQWCGRLGKIDNCQVAIYLGYVSRHEHALVDARLYLPKEWTKDKARMKKAGVPKGTKYRTRHELALEMLDQHGAKLPHRWVTGDDEMGRPHWFRRDFAAAWRAIPVGRSLQHVDPRFGSGTADRQRERTSSRIVPGCELTNGSRLNPPRLGPCSTCATARRVR